MSDGLDHTEARLPYTVTINPPSAAANAYFENFRKAERAVNFVIMPFPSSDPIILVGSRDFHNNVVANLFRLIDY